MGFFSGKKRTTIKSINQRMMSDEGFEYAHKKAIYQWIWDTQEELSLDKEDLSEYIIQANNSAIPKQFNRLLKWAKKPEKYIFGVPTSGISTNPQQTIHNVTMDHIKSLHPNQEILFVSMFIDEKDLYMTAWERLIKDYGYDVETNELTVLSKEIGEKVYLKDGQMIVNNNTFTEYENDIYNRTISFNFNKLYDERSRSITRSSKPPIVLDKDCLMVEYTYKTKKTIDGDIVIVTHNKQFELDLSDVNPIYTEGMTIQSDSDWIYCTYLVNDVVHFFSYQYMSGDILSIDKALTAEESIGDYYPRLHMRINQQDTAHHKDARFKKSIRTAFKRIGLDAEEVTKQIQNGVGENYGDCRGIYLHIGANINQAGIDSVSEYLYRYFERLHTNHGERLEVLEIPVYDPKTDTTTYEDNPNKHRKSGLLQMIQDNYTTVGLYYDWVEKEEHTGVFNLNGTALQPNQYCTYSGVFTGDNPKESPNTFVRKANKITHTFVYQVDESNYISIKVCGINQTNNMSGYSATHSGTDGNLSIPVDKNLIDHLTNKERQLFFNKCFNVQIMFVRITKGKWYERGAFKVLMAAIGIAISIWLAPAGMGFMQVLKTVALGAIKGYALTLGMNLLMKVAVQLGINTKIVTALAFVVSAFVAMRGANWDFSKILTAPNIMKAINKSFEYFTKRINAKLQEIQKSLMNLETQFKSQMDRINAAKKLLETQIYDLSMEQLTTNFAVTVDVFESPELFLARHYNYNVVDVSLGLITNLVEGTLQNHPKLYEPKEESVEEILLLT